MLKMETRWQRLRASDKEFVVYQDQFVKHQYKDTFNVQFLKLYDLRHLAVMYSHF